MGHLRSTNIPLVGRQYERELLVSALADAMQGRGRLCIVQGAAGIGKTALLLEVLVEAEKRGVRVVHAAGEELERRRPFGAVIDGLEIRLDAADNRRASIARLLHDGGADEGIPAESSTTEFRAIEAILALVEELCAERPLRLVVDDLQWVDPATLLVLHRLAHRISELPAILICAWRPLPHPRALTVLADALVALGAVQIDLAPLPEDALREMLEHLTGAHPGPNLMKLAAETGGNPLFLRELMRALEREDSLSYGERGDVETASPSLPPSLPLAILHRLSYLSDDALAQLRLASVLGSRVAVSDLCLLLGRPAASVVDVLRELITAGILNDDGATLRFRHDLIREALYQDLPPSVRTELHREAARTLAAAGAPPEQVAEQAARGARPGDQFAIDWLLRAAARATGRAPALALDWLDRALDIAGPEDPARGAILTERALSLLWSGRILEAEETCRNVLARYDEPPLTRRVQLCLAQVLFARGRGEEAARTAESAAASPGVSGPDRAQLRAWASLGYMAAGDLAAALEAAECSMSEPSADAVARSVSMTTMATATGFTGRFQEAVEQQDRAIAVADRSPGLVAHRFPLLFFQGIFLSEVDDIKGGRTAVARGRSISEEIGARWNLPLYAWASAWMCFAAGAWDDALTECEASLALADELGTRHGIVLVHSIASIIALHRGQLDKAWHSLAAAQREFASTGPQHGLENVMVWAKALLAEASGEPLDAAQVLARAWDELLDAGIVSYRVDLGPDLVRLQVRSGAADRAGDVVEAVEELAAMNPGSARIRACAIHCRGLSHGDATLLQESAGMLVSCARPLDAARACADAGEALGVAGDRQEARRHFEKSLELLEALDAWRTVAETESRMRTVGLHRGSRTKRARPTMGWDSLTTTERAVADLVADGLTNPQIAQRLFVSRHTVHTHVSHVLAKLQLTSRVELATAAILRRSQSLREDS